MSQILAEISPVMFKVVDLMKDEVERFFYRAELTKSDPPKNDGYFFVEKILGEKKINGVVHYLVKYLYYPSKFNQYVPKQNFLTKK